MRSPRFGETLFASTVVSTMVSLLSTTAPAVAQQAAGLAADLADGAAADGVLEAIVVTARKRAENLQDVSASISALSASELERRFDSDVRDFANAAPNVIIDDTQQGPGGVASTTIRGIGVADVEKSIDPAVGVVLDEIYLGTSSGNLVKAIDIERVEILRGPQGTLFGRNAIGGVINLARSRPSHELDGRVRVSYGNQDNLDTAGVVSFGVTDWAAIKLTAAYQRSDGHIFNSFFGQDGQRSEFRALGVQVLLEPVDRLSLSFSYDDQNTQQDPPQLQNLARPTDLFCAGFGQCAQGVGVPQSGDRYVSLGNGPLDKNAFFDMSLAIAKAQWDVSDTLTLDYIYGRMKTDEGITQDFDSTPLTLFHTDRPAVYKQHTHELRLSSDGGGRFNFVVGAYYWDSEYRIDLVSYIGFAVPDTVVAIPQVARQTTESIAGFVEADYRLLDRLTITAGGRFTHDKKTSGVLDAVISTLDDPVEESWSEFTPKVALSYEVTDDIMAYALYSRGYRAGGFNGRPTTVTAATIPYDPETVDNFEVGFKSELFDNRVRLNGSVFFMKYDDKQEDVDVPAPGGTGRENRTLNASSAELAGVELDMTAVVSQHLTLSANVGYLDARYKDFLADTNNDGVVDDNSDLELRRAPNWTWTVAATYERDIGPGTAWADADVRYIGAHEMTFLNNPSLRNSSQFLANASINYRLGGTQLSGFVRNLFNEDGWTIGYDIQGLWSYGAPRPSRTYGIAVVQDF